MSTAHVPTDEQLSGEQASNVDVNGKKLSLTHRLYTGDISWDFIGHRKLFFLISAGILAVVIGSMLLQGLKLGIEFKGGADFSAPVQVNAQTVDTMREAVQGTGLKDLDSTQVLTVGENQVKIQTRTLNTDEVTKVRTAIAKAANTTNDKVAYSLIGASWGKQITAKGLQALVVFLGLVSLLIWAYFRDWKMSVAAIVALLHDLLVTIGVYSLVGFTVTPATLIGVLTILGYSLYDTVVVFDKVKENVRGLTSQRRSYSEAANAAVNQVLIRSLNTTIIGVLPVAALLFAGVFVLGSGPLEDLGLALFVGMIAGAYSSIFIATPLLAWLKEREPGMKQHRAKLERRAQRHQPRDGEPVAEGVAAPLAATGERTQRTRTTRSSRKNK
ncbi:MULTISPECIES: protein translocase subunit SecF [unclassified Luteococcus]|uniref:protein translocase subunit SecF n=1 Tax=unclassified Luteococcus TaxID=2639923 RepID=UPI00313CF5A6